MATAGVINASDLKFYLDGTAIGHATDAEISLTATTRDTSSKDTGKFRAIAPGRVEWTISGSNLYAMDATEGASEIISDVVNQTYLTVKFSTEVTGDERYTGQVLLTELSLSSSGTNENATFSFSGEGNGALTFETVS